MEAIAWGKDHRKDHERPCFMEPLLFLDLKEIVGRNSNLDENKVDI